MTSVQVSYAKKHGTASSELLLALVLTPFC